MDWIPYGTELLMLLGGAGAGYINAVAGGGSVLTLPVLMLAGLDGNMQNGTNRMSVFFGALSAHGAFQSRGIRARAAFTKAAPPVLGGALLGALLATRMPAMATQQFFGVLFLTLAILMMVRPHWLIPNAPSRAQLARLSNVTWKGRLAMFGIGLYGGMFQAAVGIPLLLVMVRALGLDLVRGNAVKVALIGVYTLGSLVVFGLSGHVHWYYGVLLAIGGLAGSVYGARAAVDKGVGFIRKIVLVALWLAAGRALGLFEAVTRLLG